MGLLYLFFPSVCVYFLHASSLFYVTYVLSVRLPIDCVLNGFRHALNRFLSLFTCNIQYVHTVTLEIVAVVPFILNLDTRRK
jgi:hypothetical protein